MMSNADIVLVEMHCVVDIAYKNAALQCSGFNYDKT